jgi:hypothetical protein
VERGNVACVERALLPAAFDLEAGRRKPPRFCLRRTFVVLNARSDIGVVTSFELLNLVRI